MFDLYKKSKEKFENEIQGYFKEPGHFYDILNYSLSNGKRIRPIILLETYKMLGGQDDELAKQFALALEMIHNYSLIHDDLPDMDNDNYRRGQKTVHYKYGADMAILAGDALLNMAFEIIFDAISKDSTRNNILAGKILSKYSGVTGMIGGQIQDINNDLDSYDKIKKMYENKTCKLFMAATTIPAYLTGQDESVVNQMNELGYKIGMAFQIQDDLLDLDQDKEIEKLTYISFTGVEKAKTEMIDLTDQAISILEQYKDNQFLIKLIEYLKDRQV